MKGYTRINAILIPQRAVQQGPMGSLVYIVDSDEKIQARSIRASQWRGTDWLIEDGLQPGERIVVEGFFRILPGVQVRAIPSQKETLPSIPSSKETATQEIL